MIRHYQLAFTITAIAVPTLVVATPVDACNPTSGNRPVCPGGAAPETASFIDPTVTINDPGRVTLGEKVFIAPFAELLKSGEGDDDNGGGSIRIDEASNVQDNVTIIAPAGEDDDDNGAAQASVHIGQRVILAHGATVKGKAQIGVQGTQVIFSGSTRVDNNNSETFLSFGTEVDRATIEKNTVLSALSRVGLGVRLPSGFVVLPGKNLTNQADATRTDQPDSKVRRLTEADVEFAEIVIEANEKFAKGYSELAQQNINQVKGISVDPDTPDLSPGKQTPAFNSTGPGTGTPTTDPNFRNRIIGQIFLENSKASLTTSVMGNRVSLRGDEGKDIKVGLIGRMNDNVIFHALEKNEAFEEDNLTIGDNVTYGNGAIVHGGLAVVPGTNDEELPATKIGNNVTLEQNSVVFRSTIEDGFKIGAKSLIFNSDVTSALRPDKTIPPKSIFANNVLTLNAVEW